MNKKAQYLLKGYDWRHVSTGRESPGLAFDSNFPLFPEGLFGRRLVVVAQCWFETEEAKGELALETNSGYGVVQFYVNIPPTINDLKVKIIPREGIALETKFAISCKGGQTEMMPLKYSIGYLETDSDVLEETTSLEKVLQFASKCTWVVLKGKMLAIHFKR